MALGCLTDLNRGGVDNDNLEKLLSNLNNGSQLKSLHISTIKYASSHSLASSCKHKPVDDGEQSNRSIVNVRGSLSASLLSLGHLSSLSIDYEHLSDDLVRHLSSSSANRLTSLSINVNELDSAINVNNNLTPHIRDETWQLARVNNSSLRVKVNFLMTESTLANNFRYILNSTMPLETLRMYFCKALNPAMLQYLSDNYADTLKSLCVVDSIQSDALRYHVVSSRQDTDPDPLILLCWKCRHLTELVLVGYEILEINLIAIAKLRSNLKLFYVPMDCIIDLTYGKFKDDEFIEDEDGEDTLIDYGSCSHQIIDKVCKILKIPSWHPLEKDELPMCVYDRSISLEEAFLDTLIGDQNVNSSSLS